MSANQLQESRNRFLDAVSYAKMGDRESVQLYLRRIAAKHGRDVATQAGREVKAATKWDVEAVRLQWQN